MPKSQEKFIIIDGNALLHRAWHALPPMTLKDGTLVNAAYGFTSILLKIIKELEPDYLCAAFDRPGVTKRSEEFAKYKAQRIKQPDELYNQIAIIEEILAAFNIPVIDSEEDGYEADDVIGTVIAKLKKIEPEMLKIIVTGDLDTLQLVDKNTEVFTLKKGISDTVIYNVKMVKDRYELKPDQLIDFKSLRGDPSDNIPGVKGIGEKTAIDLIKQAGSLEKLYQNLDKIKASERIKKLLTEQKDEALLSQKLVTMATNLPTNFKLRETKVEGFDQDKVVKIFTRLEFKSLLNKIPEAINGQSATGQGNFDFVKIETKPKDGKFDYQLINTDKQFHNFLSQLKKQEEFALDSETTSLHVWQARLLGLSFSWQANQGYYLNIKDNPGWLKELKPILEDPKIKKVGHHLKYDYEVLSQNKIKLKGIAFDTLLAAYLLTSGSRNLGLDDLAFAELGHRMQPIEDLIGPKGKDQKTMDQIPLEQVAWYASEDADFSFKLSKKLQKDLAEISSLGLLEKLELPLIPVLAEMEETGIKIDKQFLEKLNQKFSREIKKLEEKIFKLAGNEFNVASPLQLQEILFEKLQIDTKGLKRTKTGISTASSELEKLKDRHEIIPLISEFREYSKLQNTYTQTLAEEADDNDRIHTSFNQTVTATGRLSSSGPNLQNIPIRTELGREIRKAFVAKKGYRLIAADYSQIELRIIASLADDQTMIKAFNKGEDIHARTAANINKIEIDQVTKEQRRAAKEVNFGVIYGLGSRGLAQRTGISIQEAKDFIDKYFELHPQIKSWLDQTKISAAEHGFVETLLGRRRYLPDIHSGVQMIRAAAERMAINAPIQGTAADLLKLAMIKIHQDLPKISPDSKMLLTVHDELVLETPQVEVEKVSQFVKKTMENIYALKVPIEAQVRSAQNWGEAK
ncbi:MAG: DNA polymerase I [Candidatus Komeilibacteria bacterium CG10_big_fil_rev_8_21_14_0_10_41_13]|uniref:DNA polymerase I n=1 Tax=Candidatus Komeilibacteria bacterium CG10_big_fil_rev_8_21_14_0_10_41_13 TaxID=1974476 RepID=A0A2M6WBQ9_9BACT|nr:MAG: DNA polymerase I [Candidatus Komeilibacteria bacterium CG10_big_fil_rev_8_21_14_0_10_41_13]